MLWLQQVCALPLVAALWPCSVEITDLLSFGQQVKCQCCQHGAPRARALCVCGVCSPGFRVLLLWLLQIIPHSSPEFPFLLHAGEFLVVSFCRGTQQS